MAILFVFNRPELATAMSCDNRGASQRLHYGSNVLGDKVTICAEYWWPKLANPPLVKAKPQPAKPIPIDPNWFVVTPVKPRAQVLGAQHLEPKSIAKVTTSAANHLVKKIIIGRLAMVQFRPIEVRWQFGDRSGAIGNDQSHSYDKAGTYLAQAVVTYAIRFRFLGSTKWINEPRNIALRTNLLRFVVSDQPLKQGSGRPYLVYFDCLSVHRAGC